MSEIYIYIILGAVEFKAYILIEQLFKRMVYEYGNEGVIIKPLKTEFASIVLQ